MSIEKSGFNIDANAFNRGVTTLIKNTPGATDAILKKLGLIVYKKVKELTPVDTGTLRLRWFLTKPVNNQIEIKNNVNYALAVEKGHKMKNGRFISGRFMLTKAMVSVTLKAEKIIKDELQAFIDKTIK